MTCRGVALGVKTPMGSHSPVAAGVHKERAIAAGQLAVHNPDQDDNAEVFVKPRIDDQSAEGRVGISGGRGDSFHNGVEDVVDAFAAFGGDRNGVGGVYSGHVLNFLSHPVGVGGGEVGFGEGGDDFQSEVGGGVACGDGLGLDSLGGIDQQQGAFASGEGAGHFVGEVHMSGGVQQVEGAGLSVPALCGESRAVWDLMVIPRSRSRSMESSICWRISRASPAPHRRMSASARVDLPWSTCAIIEKLRRDFIGGGEL